MRAPGLMRRFGNLVRRIGRDESGLAFIEFAFAGPIFVLLVLAGLELANLAMAHMRVSQIAMTVADNAGRAMGGVDEANVYEVFAGAELIGSSIGFEGNGRVVLSSLQENGRTGGNRGQWIRWQRCWGDLDIDPAYGEEGDGRTNSTLRNGLGRAGNRIIAAPGTSVMFVEATYDYQPVIATGFFDPPRIRYESAFNVRGRENDDIGNGGRLREMVCD